MRQIAAKLGPLDYPVILVGGTNGKGSVAAYLHAWFASRGLRTGLTTSPHLCDVRERIVVGGRLLGRPAFHRLYLEVESLDDVGLTYFETLALMALLHFKNEGVDLAVVEIGLGGRLDAFNILDPVVSVIASVGLEHTAQLGATIEEIAIEKAQIARPGRPVILGADLPALRREVARIGARPVLVDAGPDADFAERNARIALAAARAAGETLGRPVDEAAFLACASATRWPGRFDRISGRPEIILDAAHNPPAAQELARRLAPLAGRRIVALAGFLADKDVAGIFAHLDTVVDRWVLTEVHNERATAPARLPSPRHGEVVVEHAAAMSRAKALAGPDGIVLVCGSIYLLGEIITEGLVGPFEIFGETFGEGAG